MELKINIDGLERSVSGVTETTTCSQIIYALAHATSQRGRFVMVEKYRNVERRLAPNDRPLETLRKWREHAANVTFQMLRVDKNDEICQQVDESFVEPLKPYFHPKQSSTSSMITSMPGRSASGQPLENGQRSSSSLPTYAASTGVTGTLGRSTTRRPPPPDYMSVMEKKNLMMASTMMNREMDDFEEFHRADINKLSETMTPQEVVEYQAYEEELRQLLKQQRNLRTILKPMIAANWPQQYQLELKKSHKLKASLAATREAINKTNDDIKRVEATEKDLLMKLALFKKQEETGDENSEVLETSIDLGYPTSGNTTPQQLAA